MVIQVIKLPDLRQAPLELKDGKAEICTQTQKLGADEEGHACDASREGEGEGKGDEGMILARYFHFFF